MNYYRNGKRVNNMLALSRKKGEAIVIGNNIEISILDIRGDQIKIGITAPRDISIYRKEVYIQIQDENKASIYNAPQAMSDLKNLM